MKRLTLIFLSLMLAMGFAHAADVFATPAITKDDGKLAYVIRSDRNSADVFMPNFQMAPGERLEPRVSFDAAKRHCVDTGAITAKLREKLLAVLTVDSRDINGMVFKYDCVR